ncbi:uncharacterized protein [Diadema antillarum]|uniref:uncharacterized protein n=1 Tax=Diadema antillarum TaxID=105358 RepID=UPI003A8703FB
MATISGATRAVIILVLLPLLAIETAFSQAVVQEDSMSCYDCSSEDTVACGNPFDSTDEGVLTTNCPISGHCYKSVFDVLGTRTIVRGCQPSSDCPDTCFGNDCPYCCTGNLCNKAESCSAPRVFSVVSISLLSILAFHIVYGRPQRW